MNGGQEVACGLVIPRRQGAKLLELTEEVFNPMAGFVPFPVIRALRFAVRLRRNHRGFSGLRQRLEHSFVRVVAFIRNDDRRYEGRQENVGSVQIAGLAGCQHKAGWIPERIDGRMNFRAQPAFAASDGLVLSLFFSRPRCADERAQWCCRSSRIRCPLPRPSVETPSPTLRSPPNG